MARRETLTSEGLSIEFIESEHEVRLEWRGRSSARQPDVFLVPVLRRALECSEEGRRPVVMDFGAMEYMNSSTFTPLVKMLDQATRGPFHVQLEYSQARRWQALSFSALRAFATADGRVSIHGR
jgi:hypothetical protein